MIVSLWRSRIEAYGLCDQGEELVKIRLVIWNGIAMVCEKVFVFPSFKFIPILQPLCLNVLLPLLPSYYVVELELVSFGLQYVDGECFVAIVERSDQ